VVQMIGVNMGLPSSSRKYCVKVSLEVLRACRVVVTYLSNGETSKGDTSTSTRGLVHLTEDKSDLGLALELDDRSLLHFVVQIVTLTGTLTDTSEDGETTVGLGNVVLQSCQLKVRLLAPGSSQSTPE
jgi:hypothetical protein